jgi:hypothetical protein
MNEQHDSTLSEADPRPAGLVPPRRKTKGRRLLAGVAAVVLAGTLSAVSASPAMAHGGGWDNHGDVYHSPIPRAARSDYSPTYFHDGWPWCLGNHQHSVYYAGWNWPFIGGITYDWYRANRGVDGYGNWVFFCNWGQF